MAIVTDTVVNKAFFDYDVWPGAEGVHVYGLQILALRMISAFACCLIIAIRKSAWGSSAKTIFNKSYALVATVLIAAAYFRSILLVPLDSFYRYYWTIPSPASYMVLSAYLLWCAERKPSKQVRFGAGVVTVYLLAQTMLSIVIMYVLWPIMLSRGR
jgi:hypothetical protein